MLRPLILVVTEVGDEPTFTVRLTVFVIVSMTDMLALPRFTTYARVSSGLSAMWLGLLPTGMVPTTCFVSVSIFQTCPCSTLFVTNRSFPSLLIIVPYGVEPWGSVMVSTSPRFVVSRIEIEFDPELVTYSRRPSGDSASERGRVP